MNSQKEIYETLLLGSNISVEDLYQAFKERLMEEMEDNKIPLAFIPEDFDPTRG